MNRIHRIGAAFIYTISQPGNAGRRKHRDGRSGEYGKHGASVNIYAYTALLITLIPVLLAGCASSSSHYRIPSTSAKVAGSVGSGIIPGMSCWPHCPSGNSHGPLKNIVFGVIPGSFSMGHYMGVPPGPPVSPDISMNRIAQLKGDHPFFVHLYASWKGGITPSLISTINAYREQGLYINLALRYGPPAEPGNTVAYASWVRQSVVSLPQVAVFQITNEANVGGSVDSDGYWPGAKHALVAGIEAAASVKRAGQLVGFNWTHAVVGNRKFFAGLKSIGGSTFIHDVDFVGADLYPDTYYPIPQLHTPIKEAMRSLLSSLRNVYMPAAGFGRNAPIFIQEAGWPSIDPTSTTEPTVLRVRHDIETLLANAEYPRTAATQASVLKSMLASLHGYGVRLFQWFDLTDATGGIGDGWGILYSNYQPKPAYFVLKAAVDSGAT